MNRSDYPKWEPEKWNDNIHLRRSHNCYAYALNKISKKNIELHKKYQKNSKLPNKPKFAQILLPQPGYYAGQDEEEGKVRVYNIEKRMLADNPYMKKIKYNSHKECPVGYYKIVLATNKKGNDYHFYRQDSDGLWSHKNAWRKATRLDASGKIIKDFAKADRGDYVNIIGMYCVPIQQSKKFMANAYQLYDIDI